MMLLNWLVCSVPMQFQYAVAHVFVPMGNLLQKFSAVLSLQLLLKSFDLILGIKAGINSVGVPVVLINTLLVAIF